MAKKPIDKTVVAEAGIAKVTTSRAKYPWLTMKVGDSFKVDRKEPPHAAASNASKKHAPKEYSAGRDAKGQCRIWRDK